jgi:hypothetical protein
LMVIIGGKSVIFTPLMVIIGGKSDGLSDGRGENRTWLGWLPECAHEVRGRLIYSLFNRK